MDVRDPPQDAASPEVASWHLHWQAAVGQTFLPSPMLADRIRDRLIAAHGRRQRVLVGYTLLPTEIHLIARIAAGDTPGELAGCIGNVVSRWVREAARVRSPVMGGPFHAHALISDEEVRQEIRMQAWRPVFLGLCRGPTFYRAGALRAALGKRASDGFDTRPMLRLFGDKPILARTALSRWISRRPTDLDWRAWELARGLALAPSHGGPQPQGFSAVKTAEAAALVAMAGPGGVDGALRLLGDWVRWRLGAATSGDLHRRRDAHAARGRAIVAQIAVAHALCSAAFVARHFGKAKATLSEQMGASRLREADTRLVATPMSRIVEELALMKATRDKGIRHVGERQAGR